MKPRHLSKAVLVVAMICAGLTAAAADTEEHDRSLDDVLADIRAELGVGPEDMIDVDGVSQEDLEVLGDAVTAEIHPNSEVHEWMDTMMGGEGSESLTSAHRWMGYRYLTGGFRGGGMMGNSDVPFDDGSYRSPEEIARQRYAHGEITRREYRRIMRNLNDPN